MKKVKFAPGTLHAMIEKMRPKVEKMHPKERCIALVIDEISIEGKREYDSSSGTFYGHPTMNAPKATVERRESRGESRLDRLAKHAQSVMAVGLNTRWKQLIGYHFTDSSFDPDDMYDWLIELIQKMQSIGLRVYSLTMDMGPGNKALWKKLSCSVKKGKEGPEISNIFKVGEDEIALISDPSHAFKNVRNALQNHKILYMDDDFVEDHGLSTNEVNFDVFEKIVTFCLQRELSIAAHINENTLKQSRGAFKKMDVGIAKRLFSWDTVSSLQFLMTNYSEIFPHYYMTIAILYSFSFTKNRVLGF